MIQRDDVAHGPDAQTLGACASTHRIKTGRGHPAFVRPEMMLDAEAVVEVERIAQLQLPPKLFVPLVRCHPRLVPDMAEMGKFHREPFAGMNLWSGRVTAGLSKA